MLRWLIGASLRNPFMVALLTVVGVFLGGWAATRLPIDAVPDITNRQVQINTLMPSLSPEEIEAGPPSWPGKNNQVRAGGAPPP